MGAYLNRFRPRLHLTISEAATRFNVSPQRLTQAIRQGKLRSKRIEHQSWITSAAVADFLEQERLNERERALWNAVMGAESGLSRAS